MTDTSDLRGLLADEQAAMTAMRESIGEHGADLALLDAWITASGALSSAGRDALPDLLDRIDRLTAERDDARAIVRDTHWMARRYADGRQSYAVGMCNDALRRGYDAGWLEHKINGEAPYARDSMFSPEWRSIEQRAQHAEAERDALRTHVAEQITHAEMRIQDGIEMGATVWRIALGDIARENRAALRPGDGGEG